MKPALIIGLVIFLIFGTVGVLFLSNGLGLDQKTTPQASPVPTTEPMVEDSASFEKVKELKENLNLIKSGSKVKYYSAGKVAEGQYKGYSQIIAIGEAATPAGPQDYMFVTKDNNSYILDSGNLNDNFVEADWKNLENINREKVSRMENITENYLDALPAKSTFSLFMTGLYHKYGKTGESDKFGNPLSEDYLVTDFSDLMPLESGLPNWKLFSIPVKGEGWRDLLEGTTKIVGVNENGLAFTFNLTTKQAVKLFSDRASSYRKAFAEAQQNNRFDNLPPFPVQPNLSLSKSDIETEEPLFKEYSVAFPHMCGTDVNSWVVKNMTMDQLEPLGSSLNGQIYRLKEKDRPLYKAEYEVKIPSMSDADFKVLNKGKSRPSFEEYVNSNPLLFFKDPWDRWVVLGEYDYWLPGGCGKPVIYLYPKKETEVTVKLLAPVQFEVTIPKYGAEWKVRAKPNGQIENLKDNDCNDFDFSKFGSEYAKDACAQNQFPYLYWSGRMIDRPYPKIDEGFLVSKSQLATFLSEKLEEMGFNASEKADFLDYWLVELEKVESPFLKISFFGNREMNALAPMSVVPNPDSYYRIFLDYSPIFEKPTVEIKPQKLEKIVRKGFTVVEWGGLKPH